MIFITQLAYFGNRFPVPDLTARILGITENQKRCLGIGQLLFQIFKVNMISIES